MSRRSIISIRILCPSQTRLLYSRMCVCVSHTRKHSCIHRHDHTTTKKDDGKRISIVTLSDIFGSNCFIGMLCLIDMLCYVILFSSFFSFHFCSLSCCGVGVIKTKHPVLIR